MLRVFMTAIALAWAAASVQANEEVVLGLSQNRVAITANFDGSEILIFGAIKRDEPAPEGPPLEVVVVIEGPSLPLVVRKKEKRFGIWINTESLELDSAPAFYAVATSGPFHDVMSETEDVRHHISIPQAIRTIGEAGDVGNLKEFTEAVIRVRRDNGLYLIKENSVDVAEATLFRTSVALPSNLTEGDYRTRIFLTRDSQVVSQHETSIEVRKVGLERILFNLSRERPLVYGLLSLAIAIIAGWGASAFFQIFRRA